MGRGNNSAKRGPARESVSQSTCTPTGQYYICNLCSSFFTNSFIFHAIEQNSFNLSADNPTLQHLKIKALNPLYQKKLHPQNRHISGACSKQPPNNVCTSTIVVSPDPLFPTLSNISS
jgi:hypothetical protein